ncbi:hypothetical protein JCM5350_007568 [Sporobolomyces pararoseus]
MTSVVDISSTDINTTTTVPLDPPSPSDISFNLDSLDPASWEHLEKLCEQLLSCSKISVDQWKDPLMNAIKQLDTYLSPRVLGRLGEANAAQAKAALEVVNREKSGSGTGELSKPTLEGWIYGKGLIESDMLDTGRESDMREKRRELWRHAAMFMSIKGDDEEEDDVAGDGKERHLRDMTNMSSLTMDEAWLEVEAMEKLSILSLHLETNETTVSSLTSGEATHDISFEENEFVGCALFGRGSLELDDSDLKVVHRLGGTFKLTVTKKSLPRLERLIEFLAFALISLRLEAILLDNLGCPRPALASTAGSPCPLAIVDSTDGDVETKEEEEGNSSVFDPKLPGSYNFDETEPDEDWGYTKRSWRSSFSNSGVLAWMRLANPRAQMPLKSSRSLRRSCTVPSNDPSPHTLHRTATVAAPLSDSPSPSPSPSRSPGGKRKKVANKLRGIRNQLRDKIGRSKGHLLSPAGSDDEEDSERESPEEATGGGGGGNTSVLGLQIAGIDLKSSSWSLPWSNPSSTSKLDEADDAASIARTELTADETGEKLPPKRFEKVIEDLSQFILSTSPDVLYPPPHLLFRLRQQELEASLVPAPSTPRLFPSTPPSPSPIPAHVFSDPQRSGFLSPRSVSVSRPSALQRTHALPSSHSLALNFAEGLPPELDQLEPEERRTTQSSTATRIGLDARASLASLMTNNSSLGGTLRHQAMQFLVQVRPKDAPIGATPCEPFKWLTIHYCDSRPSNDQTLPDTSIEAFVRNLILRRDDKCSHCDQLHQDHVIVLLHHDEKIEITLETFETLEEVQDQIVTWNSCGICKAQTTRARLSSTAGSFSFAKFIELILYDSNFIPIPELCEHASSERAALVRCFALGSKYAQLRRSTISLYELRLPTAVDPDVVPTEAEDEAHHFDSLEELKNEIDRFFRSIRQQSRLPFRHLDGLPPSPPASPEREPLSVPSESCTSSRQHVRSDSEQTIIDNSKQAEIPSISQVVEEETAITAEKNKESEQEGYSELELLRRFDQFIDEEERVCRNNVERVSPQSLNLGRSAFRAKAESLKARFSAWQEKHLGTVLESPPLDEPIYFREDVLALPIHSNVLLRSEELSSILAVALSTPEFKEECQTVSAASSRRVTPSTPTFSSKSRQSSLRLPIPTFTTADDAPTPLDPDDFSADFSKPSQFELIAKPKKPPRASSGSVFRNLVRKKSGEMSGPSTPTSEHGSFTLDSKKRTIKDSVLTDFLKTKDVPRTSTRTPRAVPSIISGLASRREGSSATTLSLTDDVLAQFASSGAGSAAGTIRSKVAPSSTSSISVTESSSSSTIESESDQLDESHEDDENDALPPLATDLGSNGSRLFDGLRSGLDSLRSRTGGANSPRLGTTFEESVLSTSEHIKLKMTQGDKKFSVTAYFPRRFKDLRARCGLSENFGGKSSAAFLMTGNSRFMLKELVTKFGYSELDSLLSFAPRLLDYQMQADRPSLLSKIFGIYSIKIQDLKTGDKRKLDMIVMDNLFHGQTISRQFDLKGIASRVAKPKPGEEATKETGWDSDWLQGSVRNQLLLYPHSRTLLLDSISNDVEFLSSNGNIDFSLLVGVDDTKCTLVVGLIDTLGVFNTIKVLEHSAKKGIKMALSSDPNSVTVCPPTEYAKRFLSAMETYFVAVPDKWSKPPKGEPDVDPRLASPL